ncbi:MAG: 3-isopropylmalate dehydratase small subunit [Acidimicrobiia bacterium]|nr:3-isopropylmalate dehydratase small subunit [Acidimicrobiia bacterium]
MTPVRGRVWRFGDDVDTDAMAPWATIAEPFERRRSQVLRQRPDFATGVRPGDVIVAGRNWGCGSSREQAAENLQLLGVGAVLAASFGRIYFRNAVALAFPNLVCPDAADACEDGDEVEVDVASARVRNLTRGTVSAAQPYTADMLAIVEAGGLIEVLRRRLGRVEGTEGTEAEAHVEVRR